MKNPRTTAVEFKTTICEPPPFAVAFTVVAFTAAVAAPPPSTTPASAFLSFNNDPNAPLHASLAARNARPIASLDTTAPDSALGATNPSTTAATDGCDARMDANASSIAPFFCAYAPAANDAVGMNNPRVVMVYVVRSAAALSSRRRARVVRLYACVRRGVTLIQIQM
jgi:hypothetical protein